MSESAKADVKRARRGLLAVTADTRVPISLLAGTLVFFGGGLWAAAEKFSQVGERLAVLEVKVEQLRLERLASREVTTNGQ